MNELVEPTTFPRVRGGRHASAGGQRDVFEEELLAQRLYGPSSAWWARRCDRKPCIHASTRPDEISCDNFAYLHLAGARRRTASNRAFIMNALNEVPWYDTESTCAEQRVKAFQRVKALELNKCAK